MGDGHKGLLGCCNALSSHAHTLCHDITLLKARNHRYRLEQQEKNGSIVKFNECIIKLEKNLTELCNKKTMLGKRKQEKKTNNIKTLKCGSKGLKRRI